MIAVAVATAFVVGLGTAQAQRHNYAHGEFAANGAFRNLCETAGLAFVEVERPTDIRDFAPDMALPRPMVLTGAGRRVHIASCNCRLPTELTRTKRHAWFD